MTSNQSLPHSKALVGEALDRVLAGESLDCQTLYALADIDDSEGQQALLDAAAKITAQFCPRKFDSCSIVNARSGRCSENCKWCAQSAHFHTGCDTYDIIDADEAMETAAHNARSGVGRFSMVASGRSVRGKALTDICTILKQVKEETGIATCASLGLLGKEELQELWNAGARRYHCNLETAPSHFGNLCTSHTQADKLATIEAARSIGFGICSGGIIGMGESRRQRVELAIELRKVRPVSIPINILVPIAGTPLEKTEPISDNEILLTVALFRMAHPTVQLRLAGARARLRRETMLKALKTGINGAITGDMLTTTGSTIQADKELATQAGYDF